MRAHDLIGALETMITAKKKTAHENRLFEKQMLEKENWVEQVFFCVCDLKLKLCRDHAVHASVVLVGFINGLVILWGEQVQISFQTIT